MRTTRARSIVVYILAAVFAAGLGFFVLKTFLHGSDWAVSPTGLSVRSTSISTPTAASWPPPERYWTGMEKFLPKA